MPELAWILPPVSTNERAGYNERIRHCFRNEHSYKEKFCEISTSAKTHVLTRYKETIYRNVGPTHQYIFFKINAHSIYFLHVLRNNNLYVDTRYCLMTLFINPIGVHHRCHESGAVSRGVSRCHECNVIPVMNVIIRYSYKRHIRDTTNKNYTCIITKGFGKNKSNC